MYCERLEALNAGSAAAAFWHRVGLAPATTADLIVRQAAGQLFWASRMAAAHLAAAFWMAAAEEVPQLVTSGVVGVRARLGWRLCTASRASNTQGDVNATMMC